MERWAKHQDDKRDLYAEFDAAAYGEDPEQRAKYDHLLAKVRLMTTPVTEERIEALGPDPRQFPETERDKLRELLKEDVTMTT